MGKEKIKKAIVLIVSIANTFVGSSQIIVSVDGHETLYRGYKNHVSFGTADGRPFDLQFTNAILFNDTLLDQNEKCETIQYLDSYISPGSALKTTVFFLDSESKIPFDSIVFRVKNLPAPGVYFGALKDGQDAAVAVIRAQSRLSTKYPPEIALNATFNIVSYEVSLSSEEKVVFGSGPNLSTEASELISLSRPGDTILFMTIIRGPDGIDRKKRAIIYVK
jgi:hypothetical protein